MSRGLGWVQREILATLEEAKQLPKRVVGGENIHKGLAAGPGWVAVNGYTVVLPDGVYDLRASIRLIAERHDKTYAHGKYIDSAFQVGFSRAAKLLIDRGALIWCDRNGRPFELHETWTSFGGPQRRFVRRGDV